MYICKYGWIDPEFEMQIVADGERDYVARWIGHK